MKRTTLISATLLLAFAGCTCGSGWRPNIFTRLHNRIHGINNVGEPCDAGCHAPAAVMPVAPMAAGGCDTCGTTGVSYGGYDGTVIDGYEGTPVGTVYNSVPSGSSVVNPAPYTSPSYPTGQPSPAVRRELVQPQ